MTEHPSNPSVAQQIKFDGICMRFEQAWRKGEKPKFESFLTGLPEEERAMLLSQLLLVELEYLEQSGSLPDVTEYIARLSQDEAVVRRAFKMHDQASSAAEDRAHEEAAEGPTPGARSDRTENREPIMEGPGSVIGRFKLLEQIGEGGMGVVYMADQQRPVRRKVALKIIKPGMDTKQVVARFEAERQALALMEHANIARVLDAGSTDSGRPYFVMELVRGITITEYCDTNKLETRERLKLFKTVCQAVQHAHTKGIIHRDLKPTNVLVTLHDGIPVPKIIDFGVAKATGQRLTERTLFTSYANMVGTPLYMSPEQAEMSGLDIDTRSDIYSLGVLLYELLTGVTPFDRRRFQKVAYDEVRRIIREEEPEKPSTRVSSLEDSGTVASADRATSPTKLRQLLRGELDWIVMKALEKDRLRRYETASSFAAEIDRFLNGEPVEACPPSWIYRSRKFVRRYKTQVAVAAAFFVAFCVTAWKWQDEWRTRRQSEITGNELKTERDRAQTLLNESQTNLYYSHISQADLQHRLNNPMELESNLKLAEPQAGELDRRGWEWGYLRGQLVPELMTLEAGTEDAQWINAVAFSADGSRLATAAGAADFQNKPPKVLGEVKIWNAKTGELISTIADPDLMSVFSVALNSDGTILATGDFDRGNTLYAVRLWDVEKQAPLRDCQTGGSSGNLAFSVDDSRLAADVFNNVRVWEVASGRMQFMIPGNGFDFSEDGKRITVFGDYIERSIKEYDSATGEQVAAFESLAGGRRDPTGNYIARIVNNSAVHVHSAESGTLLHEFRHELTIWAFAFSPDGQQLATAGGDGTVRLWNVPTGRQAAILRGHRNHVISVSYNPRGDRLVTGDWNGLVKVWDVTRHPEHLEVFPSERLGVIEAMVFEAGGERIVSTWQYADSHVHLNVADARTGLLLRNRGRLDLSNKQTVPGRISAFDAAAKRLVGVAHSDRTKLKIWDVATGAETRELAGHTNVVRFTNISADGSRIASGAGPPTEYGSGEIKFWDAATGDAVLELEAHGLLLSAISLNQTGTLAIISGSGQERPRLAQNSVTPDSDEMVRSEHLVFLQVWDLTQRKLKFDLESPDPVNAAVVHPGGDMLATATRSGTIVFWNVTSGDELLRLELPGGVDDLVFSPDGRRLVGASRTQTTIWDSATGHKVITLRSRPKFTDYAFNPRVVFSPNGTHLATSQWDATAWIWSAHEDDLSREMRIQAMNERSLRRIFDTANVSGNLRGWWLAAREQLEAEIRNKPDDPSLLTRLSRVHKKLLDDESVRQTHERARELLEIEQGIYFTGNGEHVAAPHIPFGDYEQFTIEAWVKGWQYDRAIFYAGGEAEAGIHQSGPKIRSYSGKGASHSYGYDTRCALNVGAIDGSKWTHLAVVFDGTTLSGYVDGQRRSKEKAQRPGPLNPTRPLTIGRHPMPQYDGAGAMRSFRILTTARYDEDFEPSEDFEADDDTLLLYKFEFSDQPDHLSIVPDHSDSGNDGRFHHAR